MNRALTKEATWTMEVVILNITFFRIRIGLMMVVVAVIMMSIIPVGFNRAIV
jgi:hypothetical protein